MTDEQFEEMRLYSELSGDFAFLDLPPDQAREYMRKTIEAGATGKYILLARCLHSSGDGVLSRLYREMEDTMEEYGRGEW